MVGFGNRTGVLALADGVDFQRIDGSVLFEVESPRDVEDGRGDVGVGNHGIVGEAFCGCVGITNDKGNAQSGFINGGLGTGEGHAVVGGENDDGVVPLAGFLEQGDEVPKSLVDTGAGLVILGDLGAGLGGVGEEAGDDDVGRVVENLFDSLVRSSVRKVAEEVGLVFAGKGFVDAASAVGIGGGEVEEEGFFGFVGENGFADVGHLSGIARVAAEVLIEVEDGFRSDVELANLHRPVSSLGHQLGEG